MRLVLDTSAVVSGLLWQGVPGKLIDAAQAGYVTLLTTLPLLAELQGVLARDRFSDQLAARSLDATELFEGYASLAIAVMPADIPAVVTRDPADDAVLACAVAAQADLIVSGDSDLLNLKSYLGIPIVSAAEALARLASGTRSGPA